MTTTIIPARERAQAPIGLPYIAPLFWNKWFQIALYQQKRVYPLNLRIHPFRKNPS